MGTLLKLILIIAIIAVVGGYIVNNSDELKQSAVEFVNPAAKEERLLGELSENLDLLESQSRTTTSETSDPKDGIVKGVISTSLIEESRELIKEIQKINEGKTSTVSSSVSRISELIQSPFTNLEKSSSAKMSYVDTDGQEYKCEKISD